MISQLTGKIININDKSLIIDVNGIGYKVFCSSQTIVQFKNIEFEWFSGFSSDQKKNHYRAFIVLQIDQV